MTHRVNLSRRAIRDLERIFTRIDGENSPQERMWFDELERAVFSLSENTSRGPLTVENKTLRHLLFGAKRNVYRIIYRLDKPRLVVTVIHIRRAARDAFARLVPG